MPNQEVPNEGDEDIEAQIQRTSQEIQDLRGQIDIYDGELGAIKNPAAPEQVTDDCVTKIEQNREAAQQQLDLKLDELERLSKKQADRRVRDIGLM